MSKKKMKTKRLTRIMNVRFLRPVKMGGHWYSPGEEASIPASAAKELAARGLICKLSVKTDHGNPITVREET